MSYLSNTFIYFIVVPSETSIRASVVNGDDEIAVARVLTRLLHDLKVISVFFERWKCN